MPVKIRYQSVHGVTISIINPIQRAGWSERNTAPNPHTKIGVHMKLMLRLVPANLKFEKPDFKSLIGIDKKKGQIALITKKEQLIYQHYLL